MGRPSAPVKILSAGYILLVCVLLIVPFAVIALGSLFQDTFHPRFSNLTLKYYLILPASFWKAVGTSVLFAFLAVICTICLAVPTAYSLMRSSSQRWRSLLDVLFMSPLMIAQSSFSAGLLVIYFRYVNLFDSFLGVLLPIVCVSLPYMLRPILGSLKGIDVSLEEAAQSLGARRWQVIAHILIPLLGPGIVGGSILVFATVINVFTITMFLTSLHFIPAAQKIYVDLQVFGLNSTIAAEANLMAIVTLVFVLVLNQYLSSRYLKGISF